MLRWLRFPAFCLLCAVSAHAADTPPELAGQRQRFPLVWEAAQHGPDLAWRKLAQGLENYPLYPYLEFAALKHRIGEAKRDEVDKFLAAWPGTLPARRLQPG